ncbi:MAG: DUF445 domain-containing protein [Caulobacteraceae bacterium]|nr:DUF445 domain-containing protein [Caulobacteraceae bacterium]
MTSLASPPQDPAVIAGPDGMPQLRDEAAALAGLRRNRLLATGLLALVAAVFAATWLDPRPGYAVSFARAAAEAGIVGGLADWFAVTALFRRPLGLPIPHTAVLPRSKERMARALASFVENSFLTPEALTPRLRAARPGARLAAWLSTPATAPLLVNPLLAALPEVVRVLDDAQLREFLNRVVGEQLREIDLAPLAGRSLQILGHSGEADVLFDQGLDVSFRWIEANRAEIDRLVGERRPWWMPGVISRSIADHVVAGLLDLLGQLRDHGSEERRRFRAAVEALIERLLNSPEQGAALNEARDRLLAHPELQAWINSVWSEASKALVRDLDDPQSRTRAILETAILTLGRALAEDEPMQAKLDELAERATARLLSHRGEIARYMIEVIRGWDAETLSRRFELVIGSDLQYIRMNGTVVGAIVGAALFLVTHL